MPCAVSDELRQCPDEPGQGMHHALCISWTLAGHQSMTLCNLACLADTLIVSPLFPWGGIAQQAGNCRLDEVDMDIVVFTNLMTEEAEASGRTIEEMLEEQGRLLRRLTDPTRQRAIINLDGERLLLAI